MVTSMKQMASDMHHELEATRNELRRGVLEMPQEAAESTSQMRKVIVDQIEALAELNRIVARHGRGLDVVSDAAAPARSARKSRCWPPSAVAPMTPSRSRSRRACATPAVPRTCRRRISASPPRDAPKRRRSAPPVPRPEMTDGCQDLLSRADAGNAQDTPRAAVRRSRRQQQSAGIAVARHRTADGSQPRG